MKINAKSYPHPVLGNGDDLGGLFKVELPYELSRENITLNPTFLLKNTGIEELIKKGRASFIVEVECRSTFYRRSFSTAKPIEKFSIPAKHLRERVTVGFFICANEDLKKYCPTAPHADYEGAVFDVDAGDILATGGYSSFIAEKAFDPLRPPVSSFMSILEGSHHEGPMQVDYEAEKITIVLSKVDWKEYLGVRGQKPVQGILHSAIVFPALVDAIHKIQTAGGDYENTNWYGRLDAIMEAKGLQEKDPFEAAQKILDNPATRSFRGIETLTNTIDDETYE
ncbi:MAG: hypothetical protein V4481_04885 [Patescibacteria group bacterium]